MTDRLKEIFSVLPECEVFADIGCDHGYLSYEMLKSGKAKKVLFSDISAKCLQKAKGLLAEYIDSNRAFGYVTSGFNDLPQSNLALIAGMGGEEINAIINCAKFLPEKLVLQPMKNTEKVRENLIKKGYKIEKDYTFKAKKKFYDLIFARKGTDFLTQEELYFGRTNLALKPLAFIEKLTDRKVALQGFLQSEELSQESKNELKKELERIEKIC